MADAPSEAAPSDARIRCFVALEPSQRVRGAIQEAARQLRTARDFPRLRWVRTENLHLTLRFIGEAPVAEVSALASAVETVAAAHGPFTLGLDSLDWLPSSRRPRVLMVRLRSSPELTRLAEGIEAAAVKLGWPAESRRFRPHITLARTRGPLEPPIPDLGRVHLEPMEDPVTEVVVMRSELEPSGARYTAFAVCALGGAGSGC